MGNLHTKMLNLLSVTDFKKIFSLPFRETTVSAIGQVMLLLSHETAVNITVEAEGLVSIRLF